MDLGQRQSHRSVLGAQRSLIFRYLGLNSAVAFGATLGSGRNPTNVSANKTAYDFQSGGQDNIYVSLTLNMVI